MKKINNEQKVLNVLKESSGLKPSEIGKRTKMPMKSIYSTTYKLVKQGKLIRKDKGALYLADGVEVPVTTPLVRENKRVAVLLKELMRFRADNERLLEELRKVSIEAFDLRAVVAYLETKLKEAYGNARSQG